MKRLVISQAAGKDLSGIASYTEQVWDAAQKRRYLNALRKRLAQLRRRPLSGIRRDEIAEGYRSILSGRHVIFYRETPDSIEIVRVLHDSMDMHRHLESAASPPATSTDDES